MQKPQNLFVSVGAGFENDRRQLGVMAAEALGKQPEQVPKYLIFECLAERTLARQVHSGDLEAQLALALSFVEPCWPLCKANGIRIISNFGGVNPLSVARGLAKAMGPEVRVTAVLGDQLTTIANEDQAVLSKHVYIGAGGIVDALTMEADIVVTGRVADPSLVVGPVVHELNLDWDDWDALANATMAGHLIECGNQVTGGYYADELQPVDAIDTLGPPVAEITRDHIRLTKPVGSGVLNRATVIQQLLYEIGDPAGYVTPDVVLDMSHVEVHDRNNNCVDVMHATGRARPDQLKTLVSKNTGWLGEASINYIGKTATTRAMTAKDCIAKQNRGIEAKLELFQGSIGNIEQTQLRLAARDSSKSAIVDLLNQFEALYVNGPAAGGGVRIDLKPLVETSSGFIARDKVEKPVAVMAS